jgi:hypothetical protein
MATTLDIGAQASSACPEVICVASQGSNVTIKNVAGPTLSHYYDLHGSAAGTTTHGNSTTHTVAGLPNVYLLPTGLTTITLTGTGY